MRFDDPRAAELFAGVERLRRVAARVWDRIEAELDLTPVHADALQAIAAGARQVSTVADHCGRHVSSASRIVDQLVARDLITREEDPEDRRAVVLALTPQGTEVVARLAAVHATLLTRSLAHLGPDGERFVSLLHRFATAAESEVDSLAEALSSGV